MVGDWNGDGRDDLGVYSNGVWLIDIDGDRVFDGASETVYWPWWSTSTFVPTPGDWNGDGSDDVGVFVGGTWFLDLDGDFMYEPTPATQGDKPEILYFGSAADVPMVADWNADSRSEIGVFEPSGSVIVDITGDFGYQSTIEGPFSFGNAGDRPLVLDNGNPQCVSQNVKRTGLVTAGMVSTPVVGPDPELQVDWVKVGK